MPEYRDWFPGLPPQGIDDSISVMQALHRPLDEWGNLKFSGCPDLREVFWIIGTTNIRDIMPHIIPITAPSEDDVDWQTRAQVEEPLITHSVDCVGLCPVREDEVPAVERAIKDNYETQIDRINVATTWLE